MTDNKTPSSFPFKFLNKTEFMRLVDLLDDFGKLCDEANIKFNTFTPEQLLEVLYLYRNYRTGDKPPF